MPTIPSENPLPVFLRKDIELHDQTGVAYTLAECAFAMKATFIRSKDEGIQAIMKERFNSLLECMFALYGEEEAARVYNTVQSFHFDLIDDSKNKKGD